MSFDVQTVYRRFFPQSPPSTENCGISQRLKALTRDIGVKFPAHQVTLEPHKVDETNQMPIESKRFYSSNEHHISHVKVTQAPSSQTGEDDQKQLTIDDLQEVFSTLIDAANDWFELGLALKLKFTTLEGIDPKKKNSDKARLREMLALWLQSSPSRTWRVLCNALRSETVQQDVLADTIERNQGMSRKKVKTSSMYM